MRRLVLSIASVAFLTISLTLLPAVLKAGNLDTDRVDERTDALQERIETVLQQLSDELGEENSEVAQLRNDLKELLRDSAEIDQYNEEAAIARSLRGPINFETEYAKCAKLTDGELIDALHKLVDNHIALSYQGARFEFFSNLDNVDGFVECVYTGRKVKTNKIPNGTNMNCEHTWPQSQGAVGVAKTDIHHLFPADSKANSQRWHLPFGEVTDPSWSEGGSKKDEDLFEVRMENRGNTARAKFYFAIRYELKIGAEEEAVLKQWHSEDPVDDAERKRNDGTEEIQKNRNPFVDHPEFVSQISDF